MVTTLPRPILLYPTLLRYHFKETFTCVIRYQLRSDEDAKALLSWHDTLLEKECGQRAGVRVAHSYVSVGISVDVLLQEETEFGQQPI